MRLLIILLGLLWMVITSSTDGYSQLITSYKPNIHETGFEHVGFQGNIFNEFSDPKAGSLHEFGIYQLTNIGLSGVAVWLGVKVFWSDNDQLLTAGLGALLLVKPLIVGLMVHAVDMKYDPNSSRRRVILSSYLGALIGTAVFGILMYTDRPVLGLISPTLVSGLATVAMIQKARPRNLSQGDAFINKSPNGFCMRMPALSITPNYFSPGSLNTQVKLMSVSF